MATYAQLGALATQNEFRSRVSYAMSSAAISVYAEAGTVAGHAQRALYATKVVNGTYDLSSACLAVLTNASIAAEALLTTNPGNAIPDADIQFAVNSIWNALAGA